MEDEIASISAVIGAAWAGAKAMTATSGPGLSLMMEGLGYAAFTETPLVLIDVQRAGPGTGQATRVGSRRRHASVRLARRYLPHRALPLVGAGDVRPDHPRLQPRRALRVPTYVLAEEAMGHLRETVRLHHDFELALNRVRDPASPPSTPRRWTACRPCRSSATALT